MCAGRKILVYYWHDMSDAVNQIKERISIVDVVSQYVDLHPAGKSLKGKSPFTSEKTPSFYVSPDRGMYYCFSSSQGGDIFTFVQHMEGLDFKGSLKLLAERAGIELVPEDPKKKTERDRQYDALESATVFYTDWLTKEQSAFSYLESRGVSNQTIAKWRIGYAPGPPTHGWRETRQQLSTQSFTDDEMLRTGLIKGGDNGKEPYDVFRDRVMFPIFDPSGRVVGFSGRILAKDSEAPKYVNSPETDLFNKSEILFGYDKAKQGIRKFDFSLIVEGQFDVIMSHQAGYTNTVAVSGTALTEHQVGLLQRLSNKAVLALDADRAGVNAAKRGAAIMLARGMDVKVARLPEGSDPADMVAAGGDQLKQAIKTSKHVIEFLLDILEKSSTDKRAYKLKAQTEVLPFVVRIPNQIDQEHFVGVVAERIESSKEAVRAEIERMRDREQSTQSARTAPVDKERSASRNIVEERSHTTQRDALAAHILLASEIIAPVIATKILEAFESISGQQPATAKAAIAPEVASELMFTLEEQYQKLPQTQLKADLAHLLVTYATLTYKDELREAHQALREAASQSGSDNSALQRIATAQKKLGDIDYTLEYFEE